MKCEPCGGTGKIVVRRTVDIYRPPGVHRTVGVWGPCPDCGGSGEASCCEGEIGDGKIANTGEKDNA